MITKRLLALFILNPLFLVNISAQVKTELFKDETKVKTSPMELSVVAQLEMFEGFPELQSKISEFFFDEKNTSIREAYQNYLEKTKGTSLINPKDPKEVVTGRLFDLHKAFEKDGVFVCFEATKVETQSYAGNNSMNDKSVCLMYDILHNKVLTLDDIFNQNTARYIKEKLKEGDASSIFIDCGETDKVSKPIKDVLAARKTYAQSTLPALHYGNRYQILHMDLDNNRYYFTSSFNELVDAVLIVSGTSHSPKSKPQETDNISDSIGVNRELVTWQDSIYVMIDNEWNRIDAYFQMPEGSEMLQRLFCKFFFHKEGTSLKDMYKEYLDSFEVTKPVEMKKEKGNCIMYYVACSSQLEGKYMNMYVLYETVKPGKYFEDKAQWSYNFIYDVKRDAIVGFSDILVPDRAEKMDTWMADSLICCMTMMPNSIQLNFYKKKDGFPYGKCLTTGHLNYDKTPEVFCEAFKTGIGSNIDWGKMTSAKAGYLEMPKANGVKMPNRYSGLIVNEKVVDAVPETGTDDNVYVSETKVFEVVEQMPSFKGGTIKRDVFNPETGKTTTVEEVVPPGDEGLKIYLAKTVKYPVVAEENGIQGRVICTFVVNNDGSISDIKVIKSVDPSLDEEAMRVIKAMPKWAPGQQKGKPVRVKYTLPITFRLQ